MDYKCLNCKDTFQPNALTKELVKQYPEIYGDAILCGHCEHEMLAAKAAELDLENDLPPI